MRPRVAITTASFASPSEPHYQWLLRAGLDVVENPYARKLTEAESADLLSDVTGVIAGTSPLSALVLRAAPSLRVISRCGVGTDNVDLEAASQAGITVHIAPGLLPQSVAELTIALMIDVLRHISEADRLLRAGQWRPMTGRLLSGKTVGIVGLGRVGYRLATILHALGCELVGTDPHPPSEDSLRRVSMGLVPLDALLRGADIVTLHLPYTPAVRCFIDAGRLALMRSTAVLINTARGGLVDEDALLMALLAGSLGGAGIDTYANEPYAGPLLSAPHCVLTPHIGSYSEECRSAMEREAVRNLLLGLTDSGVLFEKGLPAEMK